MPYYYKGTVLWAPIPSVADLVLRQLGEAVHKRTNSLHVFICLKLTMLVWVRLLLKMADLVEYGPPGEKFWSSSMHEIFFLGFISPLIPHRTWRDTQGYGIGKVGIFPATGDSKRCRECSAPTSVTPEEGGLHVRSVGTGIAYQISQIESRIIMG